MWYCNTQNHFSAGAAIFSLNKLASPSGRNVKHAKKTTCGSGGELSCSFYLYRFRKYVSYGFPIIIFCNPGVHYETPVYVWQRAVCRRVTICLWASHTPTNHFGLPASKDEDIRFLWKLVDRAYQLQVDVCSWTCGQTLGKGPFELEFARMIHMKEDWKYRKETRE